MNLDQMTGWRMQDGIPYPDGSIDGITLSHGLCLLPDKEWNGFFEEMHRVLQPGGVVRITEDHATHPESERYGGHCDSVSTTSPSKVKGHLLSAGFVEVDDIKFDEGRDELLMQAGHGEWPKCFWVEGIRGDD